MPVRVANMKMPSFKASELQSSKGYHRLLVWQKARELVIDIYQLTRLFPREELFGITSQLRRASVSVVLNIVEGQRRRSKKEFLWFLDVADGSLAEVEACLELAFDLGYITRKQFEKVELRRKEVAVMSRSLMKHIETTL